jgi:hypothetical protein
MQWDLRFKGLDEEARIARILARWRSKLERQVQRFASDRVSLRGLTVTHDGIVSAIRDPFSLQEQDCDQTLGPWRHCRSETTTLWQPQLDTG